MTDLYLRVLAENHWDGLPQERKDALLTRALLRAQEAKVKLRPEDRPVASVSTRFPGEWWLLFNGVAE
jgi:hypothetical protein